MIEDICYLPFPYKFYRLFDENFYGSTKSINSFIYIIVSEAGRKKAFYIIRA